MDTLDLKGFYRGTPVDVRTDPELYRMVARGIPRCLARGPGRDRRDAAHPGSRERPRDLGRADPHIADIEERPWRPRTINIKPSRVGPLENLFALYDWAEREGVSVYGGGQTELGVGRDHIQYLASIFHPDTPNDTAPGAYNEPELGRRPAAEPARAADRRHRIPPRRVAVADQGEPMPAERFVVALNDQIEREFGASQQYLAAAVYYEDETLPRLAQLFYDQAVEERGHALMMAKYLLDLGLRPRVRRARAPR